MFALSWRVGAVFVLGVGMSDLRGRVAAVLQSSWPAPWHGSDRQRQQVDDLADVVIEALDMGIPCAATGCRMRQIARRHAEASSGLERPTDD